MKNICSGFKYVEKVYAYKYYLQIAKYQQIIKTLIVVGRWNKADDMKFGTSTRTDVNLWKSDKYLKRPKCQGQIPANFCTLQWFYQNPCLLHAESDQKDFAWLGKEIQHLRSARQNKAKKFSYKAEYWKETWIHSM